jgi:FKBP-type peptidyl-prolyl cis-trans isomerase (trigger factor)
MSVSQRSFTPRIKINKIGLHFFKKYCKINIMKIVEIKKLPKSQLEILIELTSDEFAKHFRRAIDNLSQDANIPGFRPGHIPESILKEKIGEEKILQTAADSAVKETYFIILEKKNIEAIGRPEIIVTKLVNPAAVLKTGDSPLCFKIKIAVLPEIKLPENYREIAKEIFLQREDVFVEDKEVENALDYIRRSKIAKENFIQHDKARSDNAKNEELPDLNDDFARSLGNFRTLAELKETIRKNILLEKEMKIKEKKKILALEGLNSKMITDIPDILVDGEQEKLFQMLKHDLEHMGLKWEDYLTRVKKEESEVKNDLRKDALKRVQYALILDAIARRENIKVSEEEIENKTNEIMASYNGEQKEFDRSKLKSYAYDILRNEKVFSFLTS